MARFMNVDSTLSIAVSVPNDFDETSVAAWEALTWVEVGEVISFGATSREDNAIPSSTLKGGITERFNATTDYGTVPVSVYSDPGDTTGQVALLARADLKGPAGKTWFRYQNAAKPQGTGELEFWHGSVSSPNDDERTNDSYRMKTVNLNVNVKSLIKPAA